MAEHRVSRLPAALLVGAAALGVLAWPSASEARRGDRADARIRVDRECGLSSKASDAADPAPTHWRASPFLRPRGSVRTKMLFVDFEDAEGGFLSTRNVRAVLVKRVQRWLGEVSYDQARLLVAGHHQWIRMPKPSTSYWPPGGAYKPDEYIRDAITVADPLVDFRRTDIVYIVPAPGSQIVLSPPYLAPRLRADGAGLRRFVTFGQDVYRPTPSAGSSRLIQGTAHLFSLPYLDDPGQAGAQGQRWAGAWDPMGEAELLEHPSAWSKRKLGWLEPGRSMLCIRRGELTREIKAVSRPGGLRAISIRLSARRRYVIEARRRHGFDSEICQEGVLVWLIDGRRGAGEGPMRVQPARRDSDNPARACRSHGVTGALDRAPFEPGRTFRDRKSGVVIEVERRTRKGYRVRVKRS